MSLVVKCQRRKRGEDDDGVDDDVRVMLVVWGWEGTVERGGGMSGVSGCVGILDLLLLSRSLAERFHHQDQGWSNHSDPVQKDTHTPTHTSTSPNA